MKIGRVKIGRVKIGRVNMDRYTEQKSYQEDVDLSIVSASISASAKLTDESLELPRNTGKLNAQFRGKEALPAF